MQHSNTPLIMMFIHCAVCFNSFHGAYSSSVGHDVMERSALRMRNAEMYQA
jgi:hypothetical protein